MRYLVSILPTLVAFGMAWGTPRVWAPAVDLFYGLLLFGLATSLVLFARLQSRERPAALLRLLAWATLAAATVAFMWPLLRQIFAIWGAIPGRPGLLGIMPRLTTTFDAYWILLGQYRSWTLTTSVPLAMAAFLAVLTWEDLIARPWRVLNGRSRDATDGPWRGGWMGTDRVRQLATNGSGLALGLRDGRLLRYRPHPDRGWLAGHHLVVAGTRGGKGVSCVIPAILDHEGPVVVLDIKGENLAVCGRHRATLGRRQVVLNPFGLLDGCCNRFEPLSYLRSGPARQRDITVLVEGLVRPEPAADAAWIALAARALLAAAVEAVVVLEADPAHRTLLAAADLVLAPEAMETFEAWSRSGPEVCGGRLAKAAAAVLAMGDRQRGAVLSALAENLAWLSYDQVRAMLSPAQDDVALSFGDLLDDKVDLWILVPQDMVVAMGNMLRLVTTLALGSVTRQDGRRTVKAPILAVLDEFLRLGRMEKVLEIATIAAGGGITAIFVAQDKGSLDAVYGREGAGTIAGACATTRIFALGRADDITAAWAERQLPSKTVLRESRSHSTNGTPQVNRGEDRQRLLDAPDIQELPPSRILCLIRSQPPLLLDRIISHRHPAYRSRLDPNPVVRA